MRLLSCFAIILFFFSCSQNVITRDREGHRKTTNNPQDFNPIRKKVALLNFFNESPYGGDDLGIVASEELRRELSRTGEFIVDPMAMRMFGSSKEVYAGGGVKLVQLSRQAKMEGINLVIFGRIVEARVRQKKDEIGFVRETKSFTEAKVEIRVFDTNSNKEIFTETLTGHADDNTYKFFMEDQEEAHLERQDLLRYGVRVAVRRSIPNIVKISQKLSWVGRVAKIQGAKIYINAGRISGIQIGDILKVMTEGEEVYDPETGALMGVASGNLKGTVEVVDFFGPDGAIAILHSGGSVLEGDFVQLY